MTTAEKIQRAALHRFAGKGYSATSLQEIADDCGIKKPSIYTHFASKEELFKQLVQTSVYEEMEYTRGRLQTPVSATDSLGGFLESVPARFEESVLLRFWVKTVFLPPPALAEEIKGYARLYYAGIHSIVGLALENSNKAFGGRKEQLATAYLGILKGLYASLMQENTEETQKTVAALWTVYRRAIES